MSATVRAFLLHAAMALGGLAAAVWLLAPSVGAQQQRPRLSRFIETLQSGRPAIMGETWQFVDGEHSTYDIERIQGTLTKLLANKNDKGQPVLTPIVRVPMEADQDTRWAIKQVLERGAMGIVVPYLETPEQARRLVTEMRFPQALDTKIPDPPGRRGWGTQGFQGWGITPHEYVKVADVWPLNPDGELFLMPMIETPLGVKNINAILETPGLSGVLVGPGDMTLSHGHGHRDPAWDANVPPVEAAIMTVVRACTAKKKYCGIGTFNETETQKYLKAGFKFIFPFYKR